MYSKFQLEIITPEREFFSGEVEQVIIITVDGERGILKGHYPIVAALLPGSIRLLINNKWHEAANSEGFIMAMPDKVLIMVQTVEWPEELEEQLVRETIIKALERIKQKKNIDIVKYKLGKASLARSFARLKVINRSKGNIK